MDARFLDVGLISALSSILMALIWMIYLHIVLRQYRRANQPFMIIHHAHENDPSALCLFVNMSREAIHVQSVIAYIQSAEGTFSRHITDYDHIPTNDREVQIRLRQGPIQPGGYLVLGSFEEILMGKSSLPESVAMANPEWLKLEMIQSLELCVAVVHGPSKSYVGARRHFFVEQETGKTIIRARNIYTEQLVTRARRKTVKKWVESRVEPKHKGASETQKTRQSRQNNNSPSDESDDGDNT